MTQALPLYYHDIYTDGIHPDAPFPKERYRKVYEGLVRSGAAVDFRTPTAVAEAAIEAVHCPEYVKRFLNLTLTDKEIRRIGLRPWTPALVERTLLLTGGAVCALDALMTEQHRVAANMAGGTHHAHRDFGAGYCIFNDLAICAKQAQIKYNIGRILIADLDVHQGDGTASIFANDGQVFTFSMHCEANFPFRKVKSDLDVPLPEQASDELYLQKLEDQIPRLFDFKPELIFFQAGVDPLREDGLGRLNLSLSGLNRRNRRVLQLADECEAPCLVFMGGGYSKPIEPTVEAFVNLFEACAQYNG